MKATEKRLTVAIHRRLLLAQHSWLALPRTATIVGRPDRTSGLDFLGTQFWTEFLTAALFCRISDSPYAVLLAQY